jgi:CubicO group peptidase (beta-lactamase class C family)
VRGISFSSVSSRPRSQLAAKEDAHGRDRVDQYRSEFVLDSAFLQASEAAALTWEVPALALGVSVGDEAGTHAIGCDPDAVFRVASITKPFTALLSVGLLDLEESSGIWPSDVRVRHLLSHTSGFDGDAGDLGRFGDGDDALEVLVAELPAIRRYLGVEQAWSYANTGYWLAGRMCAERAGTSYEAALAERVLGPAGLEATSFGEPALGGTGPDALPGPYPRARRPSGGLVSNVPDLLRFGRWLLASPDFARMRVVHGKPPAGVYGLGLFGERVDGVEVWGHGGSWGGFQSSLLVVPDRDAVFVGLTNHSRGKKALHDLEDVFFERVLGARRRVPETVDLPDEARDGFSGSYANSDGWTEVEFAVDGLAVRFDDGEFPARAIGERTFEITEGDRVRERFDFPLEGFGRFGSRLAERIG